MSDDADRSPEDRPPGTCASCGATGTHSRYCAVVPEVDAPTLTGTSRVLGEAWAAVDHHAEAEAPAHRAERDGLCAFDCEACADG